MRVLMLTHGYPPTISGVTLVVQKLSRAMARRGHEVTVVAASDRGDAYVTRDEDVRVSRLRSRTNPYWSESPLPAARRAVLGEIIDDVRPDVVHSHDAAILCRQLLHLRSDLEIPAVATCHFIPRFVGKYLAVGKPSARVVEDVAWSYAVRTFNRFDHVVFPNRWHEGFFLKRGLTCPTSIISNGVDVVRYHRRTGGGERLRTVGDLPRGPRILFVGRLAKDKEIEVLVGAMPRLGAEFGAHLLVVGRGDDRTRLEQLADRLAVGDRVHFLGFVAESDLPTMYRACDVFAIASTCEVQSLPTLQAMASGLPVVAADAGALPELVLDGTDGYLVPPEDPAAMGDALARVLRDPRRARELGRAGLELSRDHADERTYSAYEEVYARLALGERQMIPSSVPTVSNASRARSN